MIAYGWFAALCLICLIVVFGAFDFQNKDEEKRDDEL